MASTYLAERVGGDRPGAAVRPLREGVSAAGGWVYADHHGGAGDGHGAVPRVPAGAQGVGGDWEELAVLREQRRGRISCTRRSLRRSRRTEF